MAKSDQMSEERKEAGQSSRTAEIKNDNEWKLYIPEERSIASLQKVPRELREKEQNKGFFDPRFVSIGPYHHGKPEFKEAELIKPRVARTFISDNNRESEFYKKILEVVSDARNCYLPGSTDVYDDEEFALMMFLDGCFVLQFIDATINRENEPVIVQLIKQVGFVAFRAIISDIMLLENQLPFIVLQALISTRYLESRGEELIENFILKIYIDNLATWTEKTYKHEKAQPPLHFLELVRRRFLGRYSLTEEEEVSTEKHQNSPGKDDQAQEVSSEKHQDGPGKEDQHSGCSLQTIIPCSWFKRGPKDPMKDTYSYSFRSATELKARGIHFRPSSTFFLNDFTFTSWFGYGLLKLPQLAFGFGIKYGLLNMVAYELAPSTVIETEVCSYIYFMNSLINGVDDVIELRSHNIIHNFYGTDEEVAKAFNSMATGAAFFSFQGPIKDVSDRIQKHYNSKMKTWTAQLLNNYFNTPWSALAFFAATFVLVLTALRYFQIYPRSFH